MEASYCDGSQINSLVKAAFVVWYMWSKKAFTDTDSVGSTSLLKTGFCPS